MTGHDWTAKTCKKLPLKGDFRPKQYKGDGENMYLVTAGAGSRRWAHETHNSHDLTLLTDGTDSV